MYMVRSTSRVGSLSHVKKIVPGQVVHKWEFVLGVVHYQSSICTSVSLVSPQHFDAHKFITLKDCIRIFFSRLFHHLFYSRHYGTYVIQISFIAHKIVTHYGYAAQRRGSDKERSANHSPNWRNMQKINQM